MNAKKPLLLIVLDETARGEVPGGQRPLDPPLAGKEPVHGSQKLRLIDLAQGQLLS